MAFWLLKSEPDDWSWDEQVAEGAGGAPWTGVRNNAARLKLSEMAEGDEAFFYHTGGEKQIVGVVRVVRAAYPDPTDGTGRWLCVDVAAVRPLPRPVTLADIRATPALSDMALVRQARLSVQPVTAEAWAAILKMSAS